MHLKGKIAHQIINVLRSLPGDRFLLLDNEGSEYDTRLLNIEKRTAVMEITDRRSAQEDQSIRINLYQSLLKKEKFEMVLQKGTEIGVTSFTPIIAHRCIPLIKKGEMKRDRWYAIIREAAEQSARGFLPGLNEAIPIQDAFRTAKGVSLIFWENEKVTGLYEVLVSYFSKQDRDINIFLGPEGGFTDGEIDMARNNGIKSVSLGPRTLRSETAALVACANIFYHRSFIAMEKQPHPAS